LQVLGELFSEVGPIKRAFVVREKSGESKGFGFVQLYVPVRAPAPRSQSLWWLAAVSWRRTPLTQ
jgi:hypothetical protein